MIPRGHVVAGPGGGVALGSRVGGPRQHKWPLVALQFAQPFVGGARVLHPEHVVNGAMIQRSTVVEAVPRLKRHGLVRALKDRRLIHVVPEARNTYGHKILIKLAPPIANPRQSKIRKYTVARPHRPNKN